jgi:hypothetical protein
MNTGSQFKDFVERQQRPASVENAFDPAKERDEWLGYLEQLYSRIADYLKEYTEDNAVAFRWSEIELNEENIGSYTAKRLTIVIGANEIVLTPIGTLLIGSKGRVDVKGSAGTSRLVLIDKKIVNPSQMVHVTVSIIPPGGRPSPSPKSPPSSEKIEWTWKIVSRPPVMGFIELNKETFFEMLMEVSNG